MSLSVFFFVNYEVIMLNFFSFLKISKKVDVKKDEGAMIAMADSLGKIRYCDVNIKAVEKNRMHVILSTLFECSKNGIGNMKGFINPRTKLLGFTYANNIAYVSVSKDFKETSSQSSFDIALRQIKYTILNEYPEMKNCFVICDGVQYEVI